MIINKETIGNDTYVEDIYLFAANHREYLIVFVNGQFSLIKERFPEHLNDKYVREFQQSFIIPGRSLSNIALCLDFGVDHVREIEELCTSMVSKYNIQTALGEDQTETKKQKRKI